MRHNKDGKHLQDREGWLDIGTDSLGKAARNRQMVAEKQNIEYYLWLEEQLTKYPANKPLPVQFLGHIPVAGGEPRLPYYMHIEED